jgi:hypothetical protein
MANFLAASPDAGSWQAVLSNRSVVHASLPQSEENTESANAEPFTFVIGADTQLGIANQSRTWDVEMIYSERAVQYINALSPKPAFVSMCGDLIDMEPTMYVGRNGSMEDCLATQDQQFSDFKRIWSALDPSIPLLCVCGNHEVGNRPSPEAIQNFKSKFGDDFFSFWCKGCLCICLNTNLYNDETLSKELLAEQHAWLVEQFKTHCSGESRPPPRRVFLFGHHPWFLFSETETLESLQGKNACPGGTADDYIPDSYFPIGLTNRTPVLELCRQYKVDACFAGHYHQNLVNSTSWGMPMVTTAGICGWQIESSEKDLSLPCNLTPGPGVRVVRVDDTLEGGFMHCYECV